MPYTRRTRSSPVIPSRPPGGGARSSRAPWCVNGRIIWLATTGPATAWTRTREIDAAVRGVPVFVQPGNAAFCGSSLGGTDPDVSVRWLNVLVVQRFTPLFVRPPEPIRCSDRVDELRVAGRRCCRKDFPSAMASRLRRRSRKLVPSFAASVVGVRVFTGATESAWTAKISPRRSARSPWTPEAVTQQAEQDNTGNTGIQPMYGRTASAVTVDVANRSGSQDV